MTTPVSLADIFPPAGVAITCGDLELRWLNDDDLPALVAVAQAGVHASDYMPFAQPWTRADPADLPANTARHLWQQRSQITAEQWTLALGIWHRGLLVGMQDLSAKQFALRRVITTGSWLGLVHQGQGIGTRMRQLACALAFDELGAAECRSGAYTDNPASLAVSRKVGYRIADTTRELRADTDGPGWQTHHELVLTPDRFVRPDQPISYRGVSAFREFIGLND